MDMSNGGEGGGMGGSGTGGMSMGGAVPNLFYLQQMFWAVIGAAIACATLVNVLDKVLYKQRLSAASRCQITPARPRTLFFSTFATIVAISREFTSASAPFALAARFRWTSLTLGRVSLVLAELVIVIILCFYELDPTNEWQWESIGYRTGFIAAAQLPLVILLAGKNNVIGFLTGSSYDRLNWLHRWVSRVLFLTVTIHMGFWFTDWARYDYIMTKLTTDAITKRGFAAWCILLWIVFSSFAPIRRWNYEFFVLQHIVTFVGFLAAVYLHLPSDVKMWIWIPIGLYIFDRAMRTSYVIFTNLSIFHKKSMRSSFWTCNATLEPLRCCTTRIVIKNPPTAWNAGQHVFLSCHGIVPLQSHPFTIASIPEDGRMEFLVKSKAGGTKRFFSHAEKNHLLPLTNGDLSSVRTNSAVIDGPYGRIRPLRQFDSVFLIAGSSGGTFTVPLMRDIISSLKTSDSGSSSRGVLSVPRGAVTRHIRFIWVVKSRDQCSWFADQLSNVAHDAEQLKQEGHEFEVDMSIYITCDVNLEVAVPRLKHPKPTHNLPEEILLANMSSPWGEKFKVDNLSLRARTSHSSSGLGKVKTCGPDGTCCCTKTIEDEDAVTSSSSDERQCCCCSSKLSATAAEKGSYNNSVGSSENDSSTKSSSPLTTEKAAANQSIHPAISMLTGRPRPKNLIRKMLEQALGESAVVVCGPTGLADDVRRSVVALSDERAVHKGTGAQGIYLHTEAFEY